MKQVSIRLSTPAHVQSFVKQLTALSGDFELISGRHILDARSLMGVFSLDLSHPLLLKVYQDSEENLSAIAPYLAETEEDHE